MFYFILISTLLISVATGQVLKRNSYDDELPECLSESSCGYVQLNGRGVNSQQTCRCPSPHQSCPLTWDPYDGQTIVHGNDQYKYCGPAPNLPDCNRNQLAYTTRTDMSIMSLNQLVNDNRLHCSCRGNWVLVRNSSSLIQLDDDVTQMTTKFLCSPPPRCDPGSPCMGVTVSETSSFVSRNCRCPRGTTCPKDLRMASDRIETRKGAYFKMECQPRK